MAKKYLGMILIVFKQILIIKIQMWKSFHNSSAVLRKMSQKFYLVWLLVGQRHVPILMYFGFVPGEETITEEKTGLARSNNFVRICRLHVEKLTHINSESDTWSVD